MKYHLVRLSVDEILRRWPKKPGQRLWNQDASRADGWRDVGPLESMNVQKYVECAPWCGLCSGELRADAVP